MGTINRGFGPNDGERGLIANGTTSATSTLIGSSINHFGTVASGGVAKLPHVSASVIVINRGSNALSVLPPNGGQIDALGADTGYSVAANGAVMFVCLDPLMNPGVNWVSLAWVTPV